MLDAAIFDMDGVLVDSYRPHFQSWRQLAAEHGFVLTEEQFATSFGTTSRDILRRFWTGTDLSDARIRELDERKEAIYREIVTVDFPAMDGAAELLATLHREGIRLGVGSSGPPENVDLALEKLGCRDLFGAVVNGLEVSRGKPDPQVFQIAARRLGVREASCVVVEDAPAGIQAASAAGMAGVALLSTGRSEEEFRHLKPALLIRSLRDLSPGILRSLF